MRAAPPFAQGAPATPAPSDAEAVTALEPCPFCGGVAHTTFSGGYWVARCQPGCQAEGPIHETEAVAIRAWNRRTPTAAADRAPFVPTHRHYKGGLYQVLHRDVLYTEAELPAPMVVYRNEAGRIFARPQAMFDEMLADIPVKRFTEIDHG
ncbi:MAG: Lar family restriction alleviation protein [Burkholderiaceae bacterium]